VRGWVMFQESKTKQERRDAVKDAVRRFKTRVLSRISEDSPEARIVLAELDRLAAELEEAG